MRAAFFATALPSAINRKHRVPILHSFARGALLVWLCGFQVTILGRQLLALLSSTVQAEADGSTQSMKATVELDAARSGLQIALTETQTLHVVVDKRSGRSTA